MCVSEVAGLIKGAKWSTSLVLLCKESYYVSDQQLQNIGAPQISNAVKVRTDQIDTTCLSLLQKVLQSQENQLAEWHFLQWIQW